MNQSFLQYVANDTPFDPQNLKALKDYCFVFPSKRAGTYFTRILAKKFGSQPFWKPHILSIAEFTNQISGLVIADQITLTFELFEVYSQFEPSIQLDTFYSWAAIILQDFDEVDKSLVAAEALFANLKTRKQLDEAFELPEEQFAFLRHFWNIVLQHYPDANASDATASNNEMVNEFMRIWQCLGQVYIGFRQRLFNNGLAYEGMAQRLLLEQLSNKKMRLPFTHIVFAGFNALTPVEKGLIDYAVKEQNALVYWDADYFYLENENHEAGKFIREYYQTYKNHEQHKWGGLTNFTQQPININMVGVPLKIAQAQYAGAQVGQWLTANNNQNLQPNEVCIIPGDDSLLLPVLHALPAQIGALNITASYPLRHSPLFLLLEDIAQLQKLRRIYYNDPNDDDDDDDDDDVHDSNEDAMADGKNRQQQQQHPEIASPTSGRTVFYARLVLQIINHPFLKIFAPNEVEELSKKIVKTNRLYWYAENIKLNLPHPVFELVFTPLHTFVDYINCFQKIILAVFEALHAPPVAQTTTGEEEDDDDVLNQKPTEQNLLNNDTTPNKNEALTTPNTNKIEVELAFHLYRIVQQLADALQRYGRMIDPDLFWRLLREAVFNTKVPFEGEPLMGLQIMGLLDTRALDFKKIIIMGLNEGNIPTSRPQITFIPYGLRRAFNMRTFSELDSIFAYNFYRLLQRCDEACLIYNTEVGKTGAAERSRFLLQLENELPQVAVTAGNSQVKLQTILPQIKLSPPLPNLPPVQVVKTPEIMAKLHRYNHASPSQEEKGWLSASAIITYLTCPMQFYLKYVAGLKESIDLEEEMQANTFGNIVHRAVELLYEKTKQQTLTKNEVEKLYYNDKLIEKNLLKAFKDNDFDHWRTGQNRIMKEIMFNMVKKVLEIDADNAPFEIIDLETKEFQVVLPLPAQTGLKLEIRLQSGIDRLDKIIAPNQTTLTRVIDYKTGEATIASPKKGTPLTDYLDKYFTDTQYKAGFQVYFYSYLYHKLNPDATILPCIYSLKKANNPYLRLQGGQGLGNEFFTLFEEKLQALLIEIFDPSKPFIQNTSPKAYQYSPFRGMVNTCE
ncbi:MAG: PD-(D/E)XK nuclease family protein [Bacteroidetes bacterium]|nr:PD-(D/E)XK nuclease family protein [Bacteroidota bacterium]